MGCRPTTREVPFETLLSLPLRNGLTKPKAQRGSGVKMISMGELFSSNRIGCMPMDRVPVTDKELELSCIVPSDLLFARQSLVLEGAGKCSFVKEVSEPTVFESHLIRARIDRAKAEPEYLYYFFKSPQGRERIASIVEQVAAAGIRGRDLARLSIPCPELDFQRRVVTLLSCIDNKIDANAKLNGYLGEQCEAIAGHEKGHIVELASLCDLVKDKADYSEANFDTYVSTESLLPGKKGRQAPSSLPQAGKITVYKVGDILVSNIRPYFKKIWYADQAGTCSGDVLVFRAKQPEQSGYLYSCMRSDSFFDYVMKGAKGTKMPRGDKKQMLTYKVGGSPNGATIDFIESALNQASSISKENRKLAAFRDALLPKLMSGEIDVSKIDLMQLNSHLA